VNLKSWVNSVVLNPFLGLARRIPWRWWIGAACLGLAVLWLHQHDARIRQNAVLAQARSETAAEVANLKKQAAANLEAANVANARAIQKLAARRQQLERQDQELAARLASLSKEEQAQAQRVATLPTSEVVTRVAAQLGLGSEDLARSSKQAAATVGAFPTVGFSPGGKPTVNSDHELTVATTQGAATAAKPETAAAGISHPASSPEVSVLPLSASGARKVETALVELDACRSERQVEEQQIGNCRERAATDAATIQRQGDSIGKLNQALAAKDQILARQETAYKAELRAARGTFWGRLARTSKHVAIGVAVGVAIGLVVR
jgi:hypothetical protein